MSPRAVWQSNQKDIIIRASLKYLDARIRDDDAFLDVARAADEIKAARHSHWTEITRSPRR
eukprot:4107498-Pyramimonas_sp.AAC.1